MDPVRNPFNPGAGCPPPALLDRDVFIENMAVALARARSRRGTHAQLFVGLVGVGKTVLLRRLTDLAESEGFGVAWIEAGRGLVLHRLAAELRQVWFGLEEGEPSEPVSRAGRVVKSFWIRSGHAVGGFGADLDAERGTADSGDPEVDLPHVLGALGEAAAARGRGILVAVDDAHNLTGGELGGLLAAVHRTSQLLLPVLVVGAGLPQLRTLAGDARSYADRLLEIADVEPLPPAAAEQAIATPIREAGESVAPPAAAAIARQAGGQPFFLQCWGAHVWNLAPGPGIGLEDVVRAAAWVEEDLDENFFGAHLRQLPAAERRYLDAMAALGEGMPVRRSGDVAAQLGRPVQAVAPVRSRLIARGLIFSPTHGATCFSAPGMDDFLRRRGEP